VVFNAKKSALFAVGKAYEVAIDCLCIGYDSISRITSLKYLGMFFTVRQKLKCDIDYSVHKFYTVANTIYSHSKFASEISKLFLMETFCFPLISCGCECINYDSKNLCQLNVCCNNAYRKVFGMHAWDSVKELQFFCNRLHFLYNLRPRSHSFSLTVKTDSRNYINRMLYKDIY